MNSVLELEREYLVLLRHPETAWYRGVMLLGKSEIKKGVQTAYTDGLNTVYGEEFYARQSRGARRFVIMHENLHKAFKHVPYFEQYWKQDARLANICADYIVNDIIKQVKDPDLFDDPVDPAPLYDPKFHGWSFNEIWNFFQKGKDKDKPEDKPGDGKGKGGGQPSREKGTPVPGKPGDQESKGGDKITVDGKEYGGEPLDEHGFDAMQKMDEEQVKEIEKKVSEALQQGGILAGKMGQPLPRAFHEALEPVVDWRAALAEFLTANTKGRDEFTWRRFKRSRLPEDIYLPTTHDETVHEVVVAIDLSGSIGQTELDEFATELASICECITPERVRVLWWDTQVRSQQIFEGEYENLRELLKPIGGGGTHVGCVSDFMVQNKINPDCTVVFTDGYVERDPNWEIDSPTLWLVTANSNFDPPKGVKVKINK